MFKVPEHHPMFELETFVHNIVSSDIEGLSLNYFQYLRCYGDGSFSLLANDLRLVRYFSELKDEPLIYSSASEVERQKQSYWFFWDEALPSYPVALARQKFGLHHGITWVRRYKNHYDMIGFAMPKPSENPGSHYLNQLPILMHIVEAFETQAGNEISHLKQERVFLPKAYQDPNHKVLCIAKGRVIFSYKGEQSYITIQELNCVRFYQRGYTTKQVANKLNLSSKTVETYMARLFDRTGLRANAQVFYEV